MKKWLRRIRGLLGTALIWAAGWAGIGALLSLVVPGWTLWAALPVGFAGLYTGAAFALMLSITERKRTLAELSLPKVAVLGSAMAVLVLWWLMGSGTPLGVWLSYLAVAGVLGGASAAGNVAIAKTAGRGELSDGAGAAQIEGE